MIAAADVACPVCNAAPGDRCKEPSGRNKIDGHHAARKTRAAVERSKDEQTKRQEAKR